MLLRERPEKLSRMAPASCFLTLSAASPTHWAESILSEDSRSSGSSSAIIWGRFKLSRQKLKRWEEEAGASAFTADDALGDHLSAAVLDECVAAKCLASDECVAAKCLASIGAISYRISTQLQRRKMRPFAAACWEIAIARIVWLQRLQRNGEYLRQKTETRDGNGQASRLRSLKTEDGSTAVANCRAAAFLLTPFGFPSMMVNKFCDGSVRE